MMNVAIQNSDISRAGIGGVKLRRDIAITPEAHTENSSNFEILKCKVCYIGSRSRADEESEGRCAVQRRCLNVRAEQGEVLESDIMHAIYNIDRVVLRRAGIPYNAHLVNDTDPLARTDPCLI